MTFEEDLAADFERRARQVVKEVDRVLTPVKDGMFEAALVYINLYPFTPAQYIGKIKGMPNGLSAWIQWATVSPENPDGVSPPEQAAIITGSTLPERYAKVECKAIADARNAMSVEMQRLETQENCMEGCPEFDLVKAEWVRLQDLYLACRDAVPGAYKDLIDKALDNLLGLNGGLGILPNNFVKVNLIKLGIGIIVLSGLRNERLASTVLEAGLGRLKGVVSAAEEKIKEARG